LATANRVFVNLEMPEKIYQKKGDPETMCPADGYVMFRNSELVCGRIGKVRLTQASG
jgi:DNA-directed RNA polymerase III subunit RPC1